MRSVVVIVSAALLMACSGGRRARESAAPKAGLGPETDPRACNDSDRHWLRNYEEYDEIVDGETRRVAFLGISGEHTDEREAKSDAEADARSNMSTYLLTVVDVASAYEHGFSGGESHVEYNQLQLQLSSAVLRNARFTKSCNAYPRTNRLIVYTLGHLDPKASLAATPGVDKPQTSLEQLLQRPAVRHQMMRVPAGGDFWIDRTEVTNLRYTACVRAGKCAVPRHTVRKELSDPDQPVVGVSYTDAVRYCEFDGGKRLPTRAEWETAAYGSTDAPYPWGDAPPNCERAHFAPPGSAAGCGTQRPAVVGRYPEGATEFGALDLGGNVAELVASDSVSVEIAGGSWRSASLGRGTCIVRYAHVAPSAGRAEPCPAHWGEQVDPPKAAAWNDVGFRCARTRGPGAPSAPPVAADQSAHPSQSTQTWSGAGPPTAVR